jgi:phenylacetate-CoA ligase
VTGAGWLTREQFAAGAGIADPRKARGLLLVSPDAGTVVPLADRAQAADVAAAALKLAGVGADDRLVIALNSDGEPTGALLAEVSAGLAAAAASTGPRGRLRLHAALVATAATALVITPTGAMDFLARLHLEFLLDPLDLGLDRIVLTGEIASQGTAAQLAAEFGAQVSWLYADPLTGLPVAAGEPGTGGRLLRPARDGLLALAPLGKDELLAAPYPAGLAEIILAPPWLAPDTGPALLRTGHVARVAGDDATPPGLVPAPAHTVGGHICVRGRWIPVAKIASALTRIDGISGWELVVSRKGTLDSASLRVTFRRETLIHNPMWTSRIEQALAAITPVGIDVVIDEHASDETRPPAVTDLRGHHLGLDRAEL